MLWNWFEVSDAVAGGLIAAFALYKRSAAMLLLVFIMRFITEGGDLIDIILYGDDGTAGTLSFVAVMLVAALIPYAIGIRQLWPMVGR